MKYFILFIICLSTFSSCKKWVEIGDPPSKISTEAVFKNQPEAEAALAGVYTELTSTSEFRISASGITYLLGLLTDELEYVGYTSYVDDYEFSQNTIRPINNHVLNLWSGAYIAIYNANAVIEGLEGSTTLNDEFKSVAVSECRFIRAYLHFLLVNLYDNIPIVTTSDWRVTKNLSQSDREQVFQFIIDELTAIRPLLSQEYSGRSARRATASIFSADALLARLYLYQENWTEAIRYADNILNSHETFSIEPLNTLFNISSKEIIWQIPPDNRGMYMNATPDGFLFRPIMYNDFRAAASTSIQEAVADEDARKTEWLTSMFDIWNEKDHIVPNKYKHGGFEAQSGGPVGEGLIIFRLSEMHFIKAEALLRSTADTDLAANLIHPIRERANLLPWPSNLTTDQMLEALFEEKRIEFWAEFSHRYFDLKRTGKAVETLQSVKPNFSTKDLHLPIPLDELSTNPNLKQHSDY